MTQPAADCVYNYPAAVNIGGGEMRGLLNTGLIIAGLPV